MKEEPPVDTDMVNTQTETDNQILNFNSIIILAFLFTILGLSNVIASIISNLLVVLNVIPSSDIQSQIVGLLGTAVRNTVGIGLVLYLISTDLIPDIRRTDEPGYEVVENPGKWTIKWYFIISAVIYVVLILFSLLVSTLAEDTDTTSVYDQFLQDPLVRIGFVLLAVIFAPVFEELLFRRTLIPLLQKYDLSTAYVVGISGIIFGLSHLLGDLTGGSITIAVFRIFTTSALGIALGLIYVKTQNIIYPIIFHGLNNLLSSGLAVFAPSLQDNIGLLILFVLLILAYLVIFIYAVYKFIRNFSSIKSTTTGFFSEMNLVGTQEKSKFIAITIGVLTVLPYVLIMIGRNTALSSSLLLPIYWGIVTVGFFYWYKQIQDQG